MDRSNDEDKMDPISDYEEDHEPDTSSLAEPRQRHPSLDSQDRRTSMTSVNRRTSVPSENRRQSTESRRHSTESRRHSTENRRPSSEHRRPSLTQDNNRRLSPISEIRRPSLVSDTRRPSLLSDTRRPSLTSDNRYLFVPEEVRRLSQPPVGNTQAKLAMFGGGGGRLPLPRFISPYQQPISAEYEPLLPPEEEASRGDLWKRPSVVLPSLADLEKSFFELVLGGNVDEAKEFLIDNHGFNINCTDYQGVTALHLAIQEHNEEMVAFLLDQASMDIGDCVLQAVRDNQRRILRMLLDKLADTSPALEYVGCFMSCDFPADITPLILAAQCGHYEIIGMLMDRGHRIPKPHSVTCNCEDCQESAKYYDGLSVITARINVFRAIVNPAYICHTSDDPVLTSFELCIELQAWAKMESEFRAAYLQLAQDARTFAVELIGCCRSSQEVELVLSQTAGCKYPGQLEFPRLVLAMDYHQKEFVAHPNTQQVLESAWKGDWYEWRKRSDFRKLVSVIPRMIMLPFIAIMCVCLPHNKMVTRWQQPCNKMLSSVASRLTFLILVFMESNIDKTKQFRGPPRSGLEPLLIVYVLAYIWGSIRQCMIQGPKRFFNVLYNWYDVITQALFLFTFLFWFAALVDVKKNGQRDLERKYWNHLDPTLVAEGFFAVATILAFGRLLLLCQLNFHLGPLQVSLGKMIKDIAKFVVIFFLILIAFAAGLSRFYQYYDGMVQVDKANGIKTVQATSFVSFESTLKTLFWALFCMSPIESADVIIENLPEGENETVINKHSFTETVGYIAFALFEVMSVIVILNMLIATMSNTFQKVTDNVDIEWTFGRTEVYIDYMSRTTLPPPFNLLPTYSGIVSAVEWCMCLMRPKPDKKARFSFTHCCYLEKTGGQKERERDFIVLNAKLAQRYFNMR